jgi:putative acetyltransferase
MPPLASVRRVCSNDVTAVIGLVRDVLAEFGLRFGVGAATDDALAQLPASYEENGGAFWVAVDSTGELVGTCGVFPVEPGTFEVRKMYLRPEVRGQGVGRALLDETVAWARARGGRRLVLDTTEQMTGAIAFYESHGFVRDDSQMRGARCSRGYRRDL